HDWICDAPLPFDCEQIEAGVVCVEAAKEGLQTAYGILQSAVEVARQGVKLTQKALAAVAGVTQAAISQTFARIGGWAVWKKILAVLLETTNKSAYIFDSALEDIPEDVRWIAQEWLPAVISDAASHPQESANAIAQSVEALGTDTWKQVVRAASPKVRGGLLAVAASALAASTIADRLTGCQSDDELKGAIEQFSALPHSVKQSAWNLLKGNPARKRVKQLLAVS
ncbi:MAG TPA: hypothetical protein V6C65_10575, partial [Allocoleopsis sp.]